MSVNSLSFAFCIASNMNHWINQWQWMNDFGLGAQNMWRTSIRILIMQNKTIRVIIKLHPLDYCKPHFTKLKILTVISQYILETIVLAKNSLPNSNKKTLTYPNTSKIQQHPTLHRLFYFYNFLPEYLKIISKQLLSSTNSNNTWLIGPITLLQKTPTHVH